MTWTVASVTAVMMLGSTACSAHNDAAEPLQLLYSDRTLLAQDSPLGRQVLAELARIAPGPTTGLRVVTTVDPNMQRAIASLADGSDTLSPLAGQPENLQAAAVVVEPRTGRVLAYYGGAGDVDYAGVLVDANGQVAGRGYHPPGQSFAPYELAEALRQHVSVKSRWRAPASMDFPASGRTASNGNPVTDEASCPTGTTCTLSDAVTAGLHIPAYALAEKLDPTRILDMVRAAGITGMWSTGPAAGPTRVDLATSAPSSQFVPKTFQTELGLGQYPVTVLDHAAGMATFGNGGAHARTHFIITIERAGKPVYKEPNGSRKIGLSTDQMSDLTWALSQNKAGNLDVTPQPAIETPVATGTWPLAGSTDAVGDAWTVGYTKKFGVAVWVGTKTGAQPLKDKNGKPVTGATMPAVIYRDFLSSVYANTAAAPVTPAFTGDQTAGNA